MSSDLQHVGRDLLITAVLALIAIGVSIGAGWITLNNPPTESESKAAQRIAELEIIDYVVEGSTANSSVTYAYVGEKLPEKLAPDEVLEARSESSYTRRVTVNGESAQYELRAYPQKVFYKKGSEWYYREYGHTTKKVFDTVLKQNPLQALFLPRVYAQSTVFAGAGDGMVENEVSGGECSTNWSTTRDAATGSASNPTVTSDLIGAISLTAKTSSCNIYRGFFPFDTSTIPSSASITSATFSVVTVAAGTSQDNDGTDYVTVVETTQSNSTTLANADFDAIGTTEGIDSGSRIDLSSISGSQTLSFSLNSTGRGWIKKAGQASSCGGGTGVTCLGIREGHDNTNSSISDASTNAVGVYFSEETGTGNDPYLSVTYSSFAFWQFQDF